MRCTQLQRYSLCAVVIVITRQAPFLLDKPTAYQALRLARIGVEGARCRAGDHPPGATLGGLLLMWSQIRAPCSRPFSMKILLASNPEASTPAMYAPGTFVSIVAGACRGTPLVSSTATPTERRSERSAV